MRGLGPAAARGRRRQQESRRKQRTVITEEVVADSGGACGGAARVVVVVVRPRSVAVRMTDVRWREGERRVLPGSGRVSRAIGPSDINEEEGSGTAMPDKDAEVGLDSGAEAESGSEPGPDEASKPEIEKTERAKQLRAETREDEDPGPPAGASAASMAEAVTAEGRGPPQLR